MLHPEGMTIDERLCTPRIRKAGLETRPPVMDHTELVGRHRRKKESARQFSRINGRRQSNDVLRALCIDLEIYLPPRQDVSRVKPGGFEEFGVA
jgi:hypothetical protein